MDEILVSYRTATDELKADHKEVVKIFKETEKAGTESAKKVGDEFNKTTESTKSLKAQLRDLKAQIANATDPKEVDRLAKAAGALTDKINDANESVKVFASGSKFQQIGNSLGTIVSNIRGLDFERANEQSKQLLGITRSLTFKEGIAGVKDLGATFVNLGKSLLLNPIFLIGSAIAYIITNFDKLASSGGLIGSVFSGIGKAVGAVLDGLKSLSNFLGITNTELTDFYETQKKGLEDVSAAQEKNSKRIIDILKAQGRETSQLQQQQIKEQLKNLEQQKDNVEQAVLSGAITQEAGYEQLKTLGEKKADLITQEQVIIGEANKKQIDEDKKKYDKLVKQAEEFNKVLRDLRTGNIAGDDDRERQALIDKFNEDVKKYKENGAIIVELKIKLARDLEQIETNRRKKEQDEERKNAAATEAVNKDKVDKIQQQEDDFEEATRQRNQRILEDGVKTMGKEVEERKKLQQELEGFIVSSISSIGQIAKNISDGQIQNIENQKEYELSALEDQYKNQLITKEQYEKKKAEVESTAREQERAIKKKQFETDKQIAVINAIINGAVAVTKALSSAPYPANIVLAALAGFAAAAQIAIIKTQPTPKFAKGGQINGKRHSQGGTLIEAEDKEWVIRRDEAIKHNSMLGAINDGQAESFIRVHYIAPALKEQKARYDRMLSANQRIESQRFNDENLLDSHKETRRQAKENTMFLAGVIKNNNSRSKHKW